MTLVDLTRRVPVAEISCGRGPSDVQWLDHRTVAVSLVHDDAIAILRVDGQRITTEAIVPVGDEPRALAVARLPKDGGSGEESEALAAGKPAATELLFVATTGIDQVAVVDLARRTVVRRIDVGHHPRSLAVVPGKGWLITACATGGELLVHDIATFEQISRRSLLDEAANLGVPAVLPDGSACIIPHVVNRTFPVNAENIEKGWVIDNRLTKLPLPGGEDWDQAQLGLDTRGDAVGDAQAAAISRDGQWLVVSCGGTHELLIFQLPRIPWAAADPGDFIPPELLGGDGRFRRIELGGRPMGIAFANETTVVVANYLLNALQVVDVTEARLLGTVHLGGPRKPSLARGGEAIFYDADRSLNSWFSCHTCHLEGHTSGLTFDTLNDGGYNTPKLTPSLRGVAHTAPWTWHGWQTDLHAAMHKSLTSTMQTRRTPAKSDLESLVAFLSTIKHPASPHRAPDGALTPLQQRGRALFEGKAGCVDCHQGKFFTSKDTFDVGLGSPLDAYPQYNPPSLRGLHARRRFLHDGRATSLQEVITRHHRPEDLAGARLHRAELRALVAYLESL